MSRFDSILEFTPSRLAAARATIQKAHLTRAELRTFDPPGANAIRERIRAAGPSEDALGALAWDLSGRQLLYVVRRIGEWNDLRAWIGVMARARPKPAFVVAVWRVWESFPGDDEILSFLREFGRELGTEAAIGPPYGEHVATWIADPVPARAIVGWMGTHHLEWDQLADLKGTPFRPDTPLVRSLFGATLLYGAAAQLRAIPIEETLRGWTSLGPENQMVACANYLTAVPIEQWHTGLLDSIRDRYRMPGADRSVGRFWDMVPAEALSAFRLRFIERDLEKAFKGSDDRRLFWKGWAGQIVDVQIGSAGGTQWALIDFGRFSVLEFFEVNNAAFFYSKKDLRELRLQKASTPADLKQKRSRPVPGYGDNRLIHNASWQPRATQMLHAWQRRFT